MRPVYVCMSLHSYLCLCVEMQKYNVARRYNMCRLFEKKVGKCIVQSAVCACVPMPVGNCVCPYLLYGHMPLHRSDIYVVMS